MEMLRRVLAARANILRLGLLAALVPVLLDARLGAREAYSALDPSQAAFRLPDPRFARLATLGYHEAAADLAWLRTIIYFGQQATVRGRYEHFDEYVDTVIALDPGFRRIYNWAGVLSIYSRAKITRENVEMSIHYLGMGARRFPGDGEMEYMLGFNLYFEYPPHLGKDGEAKKRARLEGIQHLKASIISGSGPAWLPGLVAGLAQKNGLEDLALTSLEEALAVVEDPETRQKIIARMELLENQGAGAMRKQQWMKLETGWTESYPYLPMDLYLLLSPRPIFPPEASFEPVMESEEAIDALDAIDATTGA